MEDELEVEVEVGFTDEELEVEVGFTEVEVEVEVGLTEVEVELWAVVVETGLDDVVDVLMEEEDEEVEVEVEVGLPDDELDVDVVWLPCCVVVVVGFAEVELTVELMVQSCHWLVGFCVGTAIVTMVPHTSV